MRQSSDIARVTAKVPRGRAGFWQIICELDAKGPFSIPDVLNETNVRRRGCLDAFVRRLLRGGFLKPAGIRPDPNPGKNAKLYRVAKRLPRPCLREDGSEAVSIRENIWRTVRTLRTGFKIAEVAFVASTPETPITNRAASKYITVLNAAGYFATRASGNGRELVYRLKPHMNTGPLPPAVLKIKVVWDRNEQRVVGEDHVAEEVA